MAETVPEQFLKARIVTADPHLNDHSNGKLVVQHPDPDIWQSFNTSNVNARSSASVAGIVLKASVNGILGCAPL
jgi:hypothetical protein